LEVLGGMSGVAARHCLSTGAAGKAAGNTGGREVEDKLSAMGPLRSAVEINGETVEFERVSVHESYVDDFFTITCANGRCSQKTVQYIQTEHGVLHPPQEICVIKELSGISQVWHMKFAVSIDEYYIQNTEIKHLRMSGCRRALMTLSSGLFNDCYKIYNT
jgi:hypothetical protein